MISKRSYGAFFGTNLEILLKELLVKRQSELHELHRIKHGKSKSDQSGMDALSCLRKNPRHASLHPKARPLDPVIFHNVRRSGHPYFFISLLPIPCPT